jgi:hypothetical protein
MHQASQITDSVKSTETPAGVRGSVTSSFVINLCSSTSPVALVAPDHAGLKRFTFFVSRRREDGRERFRLHMGYFETQEEAEKLLDIVREIYPGAWAGMAPGQRLRAAAASAAASATVAPGPTSTTNPSNPLPAPAPAVAAVRPVPAVAAAPVAPVAAPVTIPSIFAAPPVVAPPVVAPPVVAAVAAEVAAPVQSVAQPHATIVARAEPVLQQSEESAAQSLSDVRAAIASLDDRGAAKPAILRIPELRAAPVAAAPVANKPAIDAPEVLTGAGAIALLETPVAAPAPAAPGKVASAPITGEGSGPQAEKPVYAVQLMWSVQPIDMTQVPQLAIFSAYTLYGAEGNREGRRWYGLRLGFFTDAVSAKQVAHYVRSEFSTVSVVPVTPREQERAKLAGARPGNSPAAAPAAPLAAVVPELKAAPKAAASKSSSFEFIDDKPVPAAAPAGKAADDAGRLPPGPRTGRGAPGKRAKLRNKSEGASAKARKLTLEETLEILGAGDLAVDEGRGELINEDSPASPVKRAEPSKAKPSRLGKLFERLSERIGN